MRHCVRLLLAGSLLVGPAAGRALAVSSRDLVELARAGLSDAVLVALIESDGSRFRLSAGDVRALRDQGLSDAVIIAMLRTATASTPLPPPAAPSQSAPLSANEQNDQVDPASQFPPEPPAARPVFVNPPAVAPPEAPPAVFFVTVPVAVPVVVRVPERTSDPRLVYWGWGGQRRPGTWQDLPAKGGKIDDKRKRS